MLINQSFRPTYSTTLFSFCFFVPRSGQAVCLQQLFELDIEIVTLRYCFLLQSHCHESARAVLRVCQSPVLCSSSFCAISSHNRPLVCFGDGPKPKCQSHILADPHEFACLLQIVFPFKLPPLIYANSLIAFAREEAVFARHRWN